MKPLAFTAVTLLVVIFPARGLADPNVALGEPTGFDLSDTFVVRRPQYTVAVSKKRGGPVWAAWRVVLGDLGQAPRHTGGFLIDSNLPNGWYRARDNDYVRSGYDRGHIVDSADRTASSYDNLATFFLSNVSPQVPELNRGPWAALESACRKQVRRGNDVYVVAGPQWSTDRAHVAHLGSSPVEVGTAFWKVAVILPHGGELSDVVPSTEFIAAVMPNDPSAKGKWTTYRVSLAAAQRSCSCNLLTSVTPVTRMALLQR
jgi:endonuclease G